MKNPWLFMLIALCILSITACSEPLEIADLTGDVTIIIDNQTLFNEDDLSVETGIVFSESDEEPFIDLGERDISRGGVTEFNPVKLNIGNYYVRHQYLLEGSNLGAARHKPFQVQPGEEVVVRIIR